MKNKLLPQKLKELRKVNNYTQDYVAEVLGVVRQTYSHYETGKRTPDAEAFYKLAGLYNISVDDLLHLTIDIDREESYDAPAPTQASTDLSEFLEFFNDPSNKKKYSRNHMILLIYIYYLKNFLSISDIKNLLDPLNEHFDDQDSKNSFYTIYNEIFKLEHDHNTAIRDSIADVFHKSEATFAELKESKEKEQLQQFAFITLLGYDIYLRKQVIEKMIDELYQPESNNKADNKKKK